MPALWIFGASLVLATVLCAFLATGIILGCWIQSTLTERYRKDFQAKLFRVQEEARRNAYESLAQDREKKKSIEDGPVPLDKYERERTFEESLEFLYPNDEKLREKLKAQRAGEA